MPISLFDKTVSALPDKGIGGFIKKDKYGNVMKQGGALDEVAVNNRIEGGQNQYTQSLDYDTAKPEDNPSGIDSRTSGDVTIHGEDVSDAMSNNVPGEFGLEVRDSKGTVLTAPVDREDTVPALVNGFAVIRHKSCAQKEDWFDLEDKPGAFPMFDKDKNGGTTGTGGRKLTIESILKDFPKDIRDVSNPRYPTPYSVADFMYARHFRFIPLNHLITLRRFPHPTYDNLGFGSAKGSGGASRSRSFKPIAQAVTFFGEPTGNELKELTKVKGIINWKSMESEVNTVTGETVAGYENTPFAGAMGGFGRAISVLAGKGDLSGQQRESNEYAARYTGEDYTRKPFGPVNSIVKTNIRDRGIEANLKFQLTFEYVLRSYAGINPRLAMMDVMCNMLALTFQNAKFWGGMNRFFPNSPQFGFLGDQEAFYRGEYGTYLKSFVDDLGKGVYAGFEILRNVVGSIMSGDFSGALQQLGKTVGGAMLDMKAAKNRPHMVGFKALLTGEPIGEWHLTVGNPYRPIMMMGNMIVKDWEMSYDGHLGVDDFPSNMKYVINLEQGMPRDKAAIESIFNFGEGKMYHKPVSKAPNGEGASNVSRSGGSTTGKGVHHGGHGESKATTPGQMAVQTMDGAGDHEFKKIARSHATDEFVRKLSGTLF